MRLTLFCMGLFALLVNGYLGFVQGHSLAAFGAGLAVAAIFGWLFEWMGL